MILTNLQKESVLQIVEHYNNGVRKVDFKAPTGSGKTLMSINVLTKIMNQHPEDKFIFIIATLSSADLPRAFEEKINAYKGDLDYNDFEVEHIESPSNEKGKKDFQVQLKPVPNKIFIFGKSTFGKTRIITEQHIIDDFVQECKMQGYKIIYLRDEAHIGTKRINKKDSKNFEELMENNANFILKMTATLDFKDTTTKKVILKEDDLIESSKNEGKYLIKKELIPLKAPEMDDKDILKNAIGTFKKIKEDYASLTNCLIRPAMLIQVDNKPKDERKEEYENGLKMIKAELSNANLSWVQYFGDSKEYSNVDNKDFTLSKISRNQDTTDCIIFKMGPATGWDIPRACMLLQLKKVYSDSFQQQTIGRIKRNPYPNLEDNKVTRKYYLYSNEDNRKEKDDIVVSELKLKKQYEKEEFVTIKINKKNKNFNKSSIDKLSQKFLKENHNFIAQKINECFQNNCYIDEKNKRTISCPIVLLKLLEIEKNRLDKNENIFLKCIQNKFKDFESLKDIKTESILVVLLTYFKQKMNAEINKAFSQDISYELIERPIKPSVYHNIFNSLDNYGKITDNYLFDIKTNDEISKKQILDSSNEAIIWDKIKEYTEENNTIKVWAKNQPTGELYLEYLDGTNIRTSYFDFVIKFENGNLLYIEVKGDENSDIDKEKTQKLKQAYDKYFENPMNTGLFSKKFVICIAAVGVDREVKLSCFYDKDIIAADLNTLNLSRLLRTLAEN